MRGEYVISQKLEQCNIGIVVLTPENQQSPWILFESGALSKVATAHLCTFLYDLSYSEVKPPLASFQHATFKLRDKPELHKNELLEMVKTINSKIPAERRLTAARLEASFETWYPQFDKRMQDVPELKTNELPPAREEKDKIDEVLILLRSLASHSPSDSPLRRRRPTPKALMEIRQHIVNLLCMIDSAQGKTLPLSLAELNPAFGTAIDLGYVTITTIPDSGERIVATTQEGHDWILDKPLA